MVVEEAVSQAVGSLSRDYGAIGIMVLLLIVAVCYLVRRDEIRDKKDSIRNDKLTSELSQVVKNNTIALTKFEQTTKKCQIKT